MEVGRSKRHVAQGRRLEGAGDGQAGRPGPAGTGFVLPEVGLDLEELDRSLTLQALERTRWNMTHAGRLLGLSRDAMRYRADKYGLRGETAEKVPLPRVPAGWNEAEPMTLREPAEA